MSSRDNQLWLQLWRDKNIEFHLTTVNPYLIKAWSNVVHKRGSRVLVPMCGKSLDMIWLAEQGHQVIGVELSPVAVKAFFKENKIQPLKQRKGKFMHWSHGNINILCGDFFSLLEADIGHIDTVYDRASLTALPEDIREKYVAQMRMVISSSSNILLLTIEDEVKKENDDDATHVDEEVMALYSDNFNISLSHSETVMEASPDGTGSAPTPAEYRVYQLSTRSKQ